MIIKTDRSLSQVRIIYIITTIFLVALSFYAFVQIKNLIDSADWIDHTNKVNISLEEIRSAVINAETNQKSFLLTGDSSQLIKRDAYFKMLSTKLNLADSLTRDNSEQIENFKILHTAIDEKLLSMEKVMTAYTPLQSRLEFKLNVLEGIHKTEKINEQITKMSIAEKQLLEVRTQKFTHLALLTPRFIIILFLGALLILWLSYSRLNSALHHSQQLQVKVEESNKELEKKNEEIIKSGEQFLKIFDNNPIAMTFAEIGKSQIVYANNLFYTSFGYTKEEVIGHTNEELNLTSKEEGERLLHLIMSHLQEERSVQELKALPAEETAKLLLTLKEKMFENGFEVLYTRKNGETFFAIVFFEVIDIGNKKYTLTSYLDIAERKKIEQQLAEQKAFAESVIENDPALILAYDENLKIIAWNKKSEELTGLKKNEVIGKYPYDLFPEYKNEEWMSAFNSVLKEGKKFHYPKVAFKRTNGFGEFWLIPLKNAEQHIIGILSITRDITATIEITTSLEQKNNELQKINKELESFNYISSHDLQEPLRQIQIFASRISDVEKQNLSDAGKTYFEKMNNAAKRMQNLISDLLAYSRTQTEERKFKTINLNQIINEVTEEFTETIAEKHAIIEVEKLCDANVIPFQFRQMIYNLIGNALKFSKPDIPPYIIIKNENVKSSQVSGVYPSTETEYCHISITDNGIGFEPQYKDHIFEVFQRLHDKQKIAGTGIGLAIVKKIVENHNGFITATGELNKGATFDIYIPAS